MSAPVFSYAEPQEYPALSQLWQRVFGDSEQYCSLFFNHRLKAEQALIARVSSCPDPVAMLFLLPIDFCCGAKRYHGRYIYAVATDPAFRSRGLSSQLLDEAHRRLRAQGLDFSTLSPAGQPLFDYYSARGFSAEFFQKVELIKPALSLAAAPLLTPAALPDLLSLRDALFGASRLYGRWDADALCYQQRETTLLGGETLRFSTGGREGYAVCHPLEELVLVKEWGFPTLDSAVLSAISQRYEQKPLRLGLPALAGEQGAQPFAMTYWYQQERKRNEGTAPILSLVLD